MSKKTGIDVLESETIRDRDFKTVSNCTTGSLSGIYFDVLMTSLLRGRYQTKIKRFLTPEIKNWIWRPELIKRAYIDNTGIDH